jgi:hypothetical protein
MYDKEIEERPAVQRGSSEVSNEKTGVKNREKEFDVS